MSIASFTVVLLMGLVRLCVTSQVSAEAEAGNTLEAEAARKQH